MISKPVALEVSEDLLGHYSWRQIFKNIASSNSLVVIIDLFKLGLNENIKYINVFLLKGAKFNSFRNQTLY